MNIQDNDLIKDCARHGVIFSAPLERVLIAHNERMISKADPHIRAIFNLETLARKNRAELLHIRGLGKRKLDEIVERLAVAGLSLDMIGLSRIASTEYINELKEKVVELEREIEETQGKLDEGHTVVLYHNPR